MIICTPDHKHVILIEGNLRQLSAIQNLYNNERNEFKMQQTMTQQEKYQMMTEAPIPGLIGRLAIPTIISMLVTSFYNMADTFS